MSSSADTLCNIDPTVAALLTELPEDASGKDVKTRMGMIRLSQARIHGNATYAASILQHALDESKQSQTVHELLGVQLSSLERRLALTSDDGEEEVADRNLKRSQREDLNAEEVSISSKDETIDEQDEHGNNRVVAEEVLEQSVLDQITCIQDDQKLLSLQETRLRDRLRILESLVKKAMPDNVKVQEAIASSREYTTPNQTIECVVCRNRPAERAIIPCGHLCLCDECTQTLVASSSHLQYCPLCRGSLLSTLRVFTAK